MASIKVKNSNNEWESVAIANVRDFTEAEPIVLTKDCSYACAQQLAGAYINQNGNSVSTENITDANHMFYKNTEIKSVPFDINMDNSTYRSMEYMFQGANQLQTPPIINNAYPSSIRYMFKECENIIKFPKNYFNDWNWERLHSYTNSYMTQALSKMGRLREIPTNFLNNYWNKSTSTSYSSYQSAFSGLVSLDEVIGLGVSTANFTSNMFTDLVYHCSHLANFTFQTSEDGSPKSAIWNYQTLDFSNYVGYVIRTDAILYYDKLNGLTSDKEVKDADTYQALKNDPDWWTKDINYSRYNHASAVRTINSLPRQCNGCIIKFKGASGSLTDGGAINTLTEEEIAVATSKGWTVSLV